MGRKRAGESGQRLAQFFPVAPVAPMAKGAEPLETVGLADDRARVHHLSTFAPGGARRADLISALEG